VHNHIRGLSPFPGAWCEFSGQRLRLLRTTRGDSKGAPGTVLDDKLTVACGNGAIRIVQLQRAGKGAMTAEEFLRGVKVLSGAIMA
jgi:methionyl-tRNA formyltransferase